MDISRANRRRLMTPSGRLNEAYGAPRPVGPSQHLVPVGPFSALAPAIASRTVRADTGSAAYALITVPKLDSPFIQPDGTIAIPWYQVIVNLYRLTQPTGVVPGTYLGLTINPFGQVVSAQVSGIIIDNPNIVDANLTGSPTATTPAANDNSTAIATTQWVQEQGYATESFVNAQGFATEAWVNSQGFATEAWVNAQGFVHEAPLDGQRYVRQNGQWVVIISP